MSIVSELYRHMSAPARAATPVGLLENARHNWFFGSKIAVSLCMAGLVLLMGIGVETRLAYIVLCCVPIAAILYVRRTGQLDAGQLVCFFGLLLLLNSLFLANHLSFATAIIWIAVLPVEALLSSGRRLMHGVFLACVASMGIIAAHSQAEMVNGTLASVDLAETLGVSAGLLYLAAVVLCGFWLNSLRQSRSHDLMIDFDVLSQTAGDLIVRFDRCGAIRVTSQASEALFGLTVEELTGRKFFNRVHVADRPAFLKGLSDAAQQDTVACFRLRFRGGSVGSALTQFDEPVYHWLELRVCAQGDATQALFAVIRDVSRLVRHEEDLEEAKAAAERANALKDRFLANVSHELRTPLNAIIGFSEMLGSAELQPKNPAKITEYAKIIQSSGEHLLSVVNTILDMSKMEAGSFSIDPDAFEFAPLIDLCCDMLRLKAEEGKVQVVRDIAPGLAEIVADKRACKQILLNLLSNAVKFTPPGGEVRVSLRPDGNSLSLKVSDTGIGIDTGDLSKIGNPFFQAKATHDRPYEGTGLGLSVVRGLVGLHGGTIEVESAAGQGTCVSIRLPLDCRSVTTSLSGSAKIETIVRYAHSRGHTGQFLSPDPVKLRA